MTASSLPQGNKAPKFTTKHEHSTSWRPVWSVHALTYSVTRWHRFSSICSQLLCQIVCCKSFSTRPCVLMYREDTSLRPAFWTDQITAWAYTQFTLKMSSCCFRVHAVQHIALHKQDCDHCFWRPEQRWTSCCSLVFSLSGMKAASKEFRPNCRICASVRPRLSTQNW